MAEPWDPQAAYGRPMRQYRKPVGDLWTTHGPERYTHGRPVCDLWISTINSWVTRERSIVKRSIPMGNPRVVNRPAIQTNGRPMGDSRTTHGPVLGGSCGSIPNPIGDTMHRWVAHGQNHRRPTGPRWASDGPPMGFSWCTNNGHPLANSTGSWVIHEITRDVFVLTNGLLWVGHFFLPYA